MGGVATSAPSTRDKAPTARQKGSVVTENSLSRQALQRFLSRHTSQRTPVAIEFSLSQQSLLSPMS